MKQVFIISMFLMIFLGCNDDKMRFEKEGVEVMATITAIDIVKKRTGSTAKHRSSTYYMTVAYFLKGKEVQTSIAKDSTLAKYTFLDKLKTRTTIGDRKTAKIRIGNDLFRAYKVGDNISIVYLLSEPEKIMIKEK